MIRVTSFSAAGGHPVNEDVFVVRLHPAGGAGWLCFLADGQGGRSGGAEAAEIACGVAAEAAAGRPVGELMKPAAWSDLLRAADRAVLRDPVAGFTTLLGFRIADGLLVGASSGDSAILVRSGAGPVEDVTREQHKNPPVGSGAARFVAFSARLIAPWTAIAMSDGVWKYAGWDAIGRAAASERGEALAATLQAAARLPRTGAFPDDFTVVIFEDSP